MRLASVLPFFIPWCAAAISPPASYLEEHFKEPLQEFGISELSGGLSGSANYKVEFKGKKYVLRILSHRESTEVKKREVEANLYASRLGIAPKIYYVAPHYEALLMDFVEGETLTDHVFLDADCFLHLLQTIRTLHLSRGDYPAGVTAFDKIENELGVLMKSKRAYLHNEIQLALEKLRVIRESFSSDPLVPCHNDLNALNILRHNGLFKIIDWTDAGLGTFYQDLGYFSLVNQVKDIKEMLILYLGRDPVAQEIRKIRLMQQVSKLRLFTTLFLVVEPEIGNLQKREERREELRRALKADDKLSLDQYFEMHRNGTLHGSATILALALASLRSFLSENYTESVSKFGFWQRESSRD